MRSELSSHLAATMVAGAIGAVTFLLTWPTQAGISWDLYAYLTSVGVLDQGGGFTSLGRPDILRSGFVAMLAGMHWIGVESIDGIFIFITLWASALISASFLLARQLFGLAVGLVTALLLLSSHGFVAALPRHLDHVWPTLLLIVAMLLYAPSRMPRTAPTIIAGLLVAFSVTVKETAALFLAMPLALLVTGYRPGPWLAGFYAAAAGFFVAWWAFATAIAPQAGDLSNVAIVAEHEMTNTGTWLDSLFHHSDVVFGKAASTRIATFNTAGVVESFWRIQGSFPLLMLTPLALSHLCLAWRRGCSVEPIRYLNVLSIIALPLLLLTIMLDLRLGQMLIVPVLGAIAIAASLHLLSRRWRGRAPLVAAVAFVVGMNAVASKTPTWRWPWFGTVAHQKDNTELLKARLVARHVPKGSVLVQWLGAGPFMTPFLTRGMMHKALPLRIESPDICAHSDGRSDVFSMPMSLASEVPRLFAALPEQLSLPAYDDGRMPEVYLMLRMDAVAEFLLNRWFIAHPQAKLVYNGSKDTSPIVIYKLEQPFHAALGEPTLRIDRRFLADKKENLLPKPYASRWNDDHRTNYREWITACLHAQPALRGTDFNFTATDQ